MGIEAACFGMIVACDGPPEAHGDFPYRDETVAAPRNEREARQELRKRGWVFLRDGRTFHSKECWLKYRV